MGIPPFVEGGHREAYDLDDFYRVFEPQWRSPQLSPGLKIRRRFRPNQKAFSQLACNMI